MSLPVSREPHPGGRWETIRYALDSNPRTLRLCLIWFVVIVSPVVGTVITLLMRHLLLQRPRIERAFGGSDPAVPGTTGAQGTETTTDPYCGGVEESHLRNTEIRPILLPVAA